MGASGNGMVTSAATLCASSAIGAMHAVFTNAPGATVSSQAPPSTAVVDGTPGGAGNEIKLVSVLASVSGEEVETRWGVHPRFRQDLRPEEAQELSRLMNRVTVILGKRYADVAFSPEWASWHRMGHA